MDGFGTGGGSLALAELIDEHGDALVADFADHYGLRLAFVVFEWSPREVLALVEGLPMGGRLVANIAGGDKWREFWGWDRDRHMLADLWDLTVQINTDPKKKPFKYPRPGSKPVSQGTPFTAMIPRNLGGK